MTTPPHIPVGTVQCSNCHTNTAASFVTYTMKSFVGQRQPLRLLPQRLVHGRGHKRRTGHGLIPKSRGDERLGLRHLPRKRGRELHELGGRQVTSTRRATPIARPVTTAPSRWG